MTQTKLIAMSHFCLSSPQFISGGPLVCPSPSQVQFLQQELRGLSCLPKVFLPQAVPSRHKTDLQVEFLRQENQAAAGPEVSALDVAALDEG